MQPSPAIDLARAELAAQLARGRTPDHRCAQRRAVALKLGDLARVAAAVAAVRRALLVDRSIPVRASLLRQLDILEHDRRVLETQLAALQPSSKVTSDKCQGTSGNGAHLSPVTCHLSPDPFSPRTGGVHQDDAASGRPDPGTNAPSKAAPPPSVAPSPNACSPAALGRRSPAAPGRSSNHRSAEPAVVVEGDPRVPPPHALSLRPPRLCAAPPSLCGVTDDDDDDRHYEYGQ